MRKRSNKIVSLLDFIKTGKFDIVELGFTKEQVLSKFCKPDDKSDMGHGMSIWNYSTFELHFLDEELVALWCDGLRWLKNPCKKQFKFDKWIFSDVKNLIISYFCALLAEQEVKYTVKSMTHGSEPKALPDNLIIFIENTDVHIYFEDINETATSILEYHLIGIGASENRFTYNTKDIEL